MDLKKSTRFRLIDSLGHTICYCITEEETTPDIVKQMFCDLSPMKVEALSNEEYKAHFNK